MIFRSSAFINALNNSNFCFVHNMSAVLNELKIHLQFSFILQNIEIARTFQCYGQLYYKGGLGKT